MPYRYPSYQYRPDDRGPLVRELYKLGYEWSEGLDVDEALKKIENDIGDNCPYIVAGSDMCPGTIIFSQRAPASRVFVNSPRHMISYLKKHGKVWKNAEDEIELADLLLDADPAGMPAPAQPVDDQEGVVPHVRGFKANIVMADPVMLDPDVQAYLAHDAAMQEELYNRVRPDLEAF